MAIATTGISGLDAQLGGGIPRGTTLLIVSEPGNAIPLFCEQFVGGGLDIGDDAHFFEFDRPVAGIRERVNGFVMRGHENKAALNLYDGYSPQFGQSRTGRLRDANAIPIPSLHALSTMLGALGQQSVTRPYRIVIESLSSLAREDNERELLEFARNLVYLGYDLGGLHVVGLVKGMHSADFETRLRHICGGVMEFGVERKGFGTYNYLYVTKLLNVEDPVKILLWKETEKGLWLESTKRVF
ncbi:MAG: RAD55 family ATPase [Candidatus Thermoplasmatota archaeon]